MNFIEMSIKIQWYYPSEKMFFVFKPLRPAHTSVIWIIGGLGGFAEQLPSHYLNQ